MNLRTKKKLQPYVYIAPALIIIIIVLGIPLLNLVWYSFAKVNLVGKLQEWVGLKNYKYMLTPEFLATLGRTAVWVVAGVSGIYLFGITISLCLNKPMPGCGFLRAAVIVPWVIPHVFVGTMWMWVFNSQSGIVNTILISLGLIDSPISFLSESLALATVIWVRIWKGVPFMVMSLISAMQAIPAEVEEAAQIDGAVGRKYLFKILLPLLSPVLIMSGTILTAWSITIFDIVYVITAGGPAKATELLSITIYKKAFIESNLGGASSIAVVTMILVSIFGYFQMRGNMKGDE